MRVLWVKKSLYPSQQGNGKGITKKESKKEDGKACGNSEEARKYEMEFEVTSLKRKEEIRKRISVSGWERDYSKKKKKGKFNIG